MSIDKARLHKIFVQTGFVYLKKRYQFTFRKTPRRRAKLLSASDSPLYQTILFKIPMRKRRLRTCVNGEFAIQIKVIGAVKCGQF